MTTIIRVKYACRNGSDEEGAETEMVDKELLVNINCPMRIILNYIRNVAGLDDTREFDLCDDLHCHLTNVSFFEPCTSGLDVLQADLTYLIITYERDATGQMVNLTPVISSKAAKKCLETFAKLRKSHRKNSSVKSSFKRDSNVNESTVRDPNTPLKRDKDSATPKIQTSYLKKCLICLGAF